MQRIKGWRAGIAAAALAWCGVAAHADEPEILTQAQAREEIELVYARIIAEHPEPHWFSNARTWSHEMARLRQRRGPVSSVEHYFAVARLMALATDTHVQIYPNPHTPGFDRSFPIRFRLFAEGVYVVAADDPYRDWVGARAISVGGRPINDIVGDLAVYAFADHPLRKRSWGVDYLLPHPATYRHLGLTDADGGVDVVLETLEGARRDARLCETADASYDDVHASGTASG